MKRVYIFLLLVFSALGVNAQQLQTSSMYDMQGLLHNPAMAGINKHGVIGATYRSIWDGIDGGPQTATLFGSAYISSAKIGIGGYVYNDKTGPTSRMGLQMSYAYHVAINDDALFSLAIPFLVPPL